MSGIRISVTFQTMPLRAAARFSVADVVFIISPERKVIGRADSFPNKDRAGFIHDFVNTSAPSNNGR